MVAVHTGAHCVQEFALCLWPEMYRWRCTRKRLSFCCLPSFAVCFTLILYSDFLPFILFLLSAIQFFPLLSLFLFFHVSFISFFTIFIFSLPPFLISSCCSFIHLFFSSPSSVFLFFASFPFFHFLFLPLFLSESPLFCFFFFSFILSILPSPHSPSFFCPHSLHLTLSSFLSSTLYYLHSPFLFCVFLSFVYPYFFPFLSACILITQPGDVMSSWHSLVSHYTLPHLPWPWMYCDMI